MRVEWKKIWNKTRYHDEGFFFLLSFYTRICETKKKSEGKLDSMRI